LGLEKPSVSFLPRAAPWAIELRRFAAEEFSRAADKASYATT
jgi:hypothetical protein